MQVDGYISGSQNTLGTANDPAKLALASFTTNSSFASAATRLGTSTVAASTSSIAAVAQGMFNSLVIVPIGVGSNNGTASFRVWTVKPLTDSADNVDGYQRLLIADVDITLCATAVPSALVPSGVSALYVDAVSATSYSITPSGVNAVSPGSDFAGTLLVDMAGCDVEIEFAVDGSNVTSLNALVWRI